MPSTRLFSGSNNRPRFRRSFSSIPRRIRLCNSWEVQSISERKCRAFMVDYLCYSKAQVRCPVLRNNGLDLRLGAAQGDETGKPRSYKEMSRLRSEEHTSELQSPFHLVC